MESDPGCLQDLLKDLKDRLRDETMTEEVVAALILDG